MTQRLNPRALLTNACGNTAAFVAYVAVSFALTPLILHALGDVRYGAWGFVESFIAYLTLLDLGVAAALVRFVPRHLARGDIAGLDRLYSAALTFFLAGAAVALASGAAFDAVVLDRFLRTPELRDEFRWLFRILVVNFALTLPLSIYPAILDGLGRFVFKGSVRMGVLALRVPLTLAALRCESPLVALGCVVTGCNVLEHAILAIGVWRQLPHLRYRPRGVDRARVREVAGYSWHAFVAMIAGRLAFHSDAFVIGPILGPAAITVFNIPAGLVERGKALLRSATMTLTSAFSALEAAGESARLRATFLTSSRWAWYAALPVQAGLLTLGHPFMSLWVGRHHANASMPTAYVLASVMALTVAQSVAARLLYGTGRLRGFARATVVEGVANLVLSLALVGPLGVFGVALGTAVPHAAFCVFVIALVCRTLNVTAFEYARQALLPLALIAPVAAAWAVCNVSSWLTFFAAVGGGLVVYAILVAVVEGYSSRVKMPRGRWLANPLPWRAAG